MTTKTYFKTFKLGRFSLKTYCLIFAFLHSFLITAQRENDDRVMLQGFYWESAANNPNNWYNIVNNLSQEISDIGIDMIWLPPPSDAGSLEGYLPRELNNFENNYGSLQAHLDLLNALNSKGIEPIADIVINHRVGSTNYVDFTNPEWGTDAITSNDEVWSVPEYFNTNPRGSYDTGTSYEAARDVDHTKTYVQNSIINFLNNLKNIGYKGWRYDFVHGFDNYYYTLYNGATNPTFSVGENYNSSKQVIQDWIDGTGSTAFDFPTYFTLKSVIRDNNYSYLANNGEASGGIGWDPRNNTTFVENHDTPRYDTPNNVLNSGNVVQTYAYLLTHPGVPCIYWPHLFDWGDAVKGEISDLIAIRKNAGIHSQSNVTINTAQNGLYAAIVNGNNYDVAMKIGPNDWSPSGSNWSLVASGNNYAVWTNSDDTTDDDNDTSTFKVYTQDYATIYSWDDNLNATNGAWPGTTLNNEGNGWFSATVTGSCSNLIFSNNGGNQTDDLFTCSNMPYYYDNSWHASPPNTTSESFKIYVKDYTHVYTWNNNQEATSGQWPGTQLKEANNGFKTITIGQDCSNIIFSYNGNNQTVNLSTCSNKPYYYNNAWHSTPTDMRLSTNENSTINDFVIYPNPLKDKLFFNVNIKDTRGTVSVKIINFKGASTNVYSNTLSKGKHTITFNRDDLKLGNGLYFLRVAVNGKIINKKISLE